MSARRRGSLLLFRLHGVVDLDEARIDCGHRHEEREILPRVLPTRPYRWSIEFGHEVHCGAIVESSEEDIRDTVNVMQR